MKAIRLQTEYLFEPLGLGNAQPRFYWNCEGGKLQSAYCIECVHDGETVWDSGKVQSASMTHIRYEGKPLKSRDLVTWRVTLWDENGEEGEPSESRFELGLLNASDFTAKWIAGDYKPQKNRRYPVDCFRKTFAAAKPIRKARLYAAARGVYDVTINGTRIEDFILAPGMTDYRKRIQVQTYDVTALLKEQNAIELRLADGWYRGSVAAYGVTNVYGMQTSCFAQLELTYADGSRETVCTDQTWAWSNDGPIRFADLKDGEIYNAAMTPSFAGQAIEVAPPKAALVASDNVPVTEHEHFVPMRSGNILDFGQNIAGYLRFTVKGKPGQRVSLILGELVKDGHVDLTNMQESRPASGWTQMGLIKKLLTNQISGENDPTPWQQITVFCSGGEDHYKTSFAVFGFRYAEIIGDAALSDVEAIAVYSDMEQTGDFSCSDPLVNRLVENTRWSMKGNFLDVPTDCPTRERLGWTGDAQVFFDTGAYLMNTAPFFRKWLVDMQDAQYKDGMIPAVLPYSGVEMMYKSTGTSVGWADAIYLIPYRYWLRFGDKSLLSACWPMMQRYADAVLKKLEKDGHYEKGIHLGEWLEPEEFRDKVYGTKAKHPEEATAYLYLTMTTVAKIADLLGKDASAYQAAAERAKAIYPTFAELDTDRQAKLVRPLALGLLDGEAKQKAQSRLKLAAKRYDYKVGTGFLSTPFVLCTLTEAGEAETAYKMLLNTQRPGWLYEVGQGATTVWESWEGDLSRNHYSPGAVCEWLFDTVAGIRVDGENHFVIAPIPGGTLTHAEASYLSPYGKVESRWERTESGTTFTVTVPANTTAEVRLPNGRTEQITAGRYEYVV
ncbi:MAG: family 78 glycoside hydrolase catalytic domain [Clostridia bacterium]|nr:family 78 glycoside hydrolase catalytic domain [Clostridia bacterium]